jgi:hypothetical protein
VPTDLDTTEVPLSIPAENNVEAEKVTGLKTSTLD